MLQPNSTCVNSHFESVHPGDVHFDFFLFKSQPFCISLFPFSQGRKQGLLFFVPVFYFPPSALYFYSNRETSAQVGEHAAASSPPPCGDGRWSLRYGASWDSPAVGSPNMGIGSCRAPDLFPDTLGAELGTRHSTSLAWEGFPNSGPCFQ